MKKYIKKGKRSLVKNNLDLPDELLRLEIKKLSEEVRIRFAKKGISDIFDILSDIAFLIRKPLDVKGLSGFITYFENRFIVYLNSNFTLGHERYTAAHELYHVMYNEDILKKEKVFLDKEKYKEEEMKADVFAAEFLMPEDYVKEAFYKTINLDKGSLQPKHVVQLHNYFKVSYKAMLKRLVQLDLCSSKRYPELVEISSLENKNKLQSITREEGFNIDLIIPSKNNYVPREYIIYIKANYENGKISYEDMKKTLKFIELNPEELGYEEK